MHSEDRRVQKLSQIRDSLRGYVADYLQRYHNRTDAVAVPSVVMVVDLDLPQYPTVQAMRHTIRRAHNNEYTVCVWTFVVPQQLAINSLRERDFA